LADFLLTSLFGGVPFLDDTFDAAGLLTAVACVRRHLDEGRGLPTLELGAYLQPDIALQSARRRGGLVAIASSKLDDDLARRVEAAILDVVEAVPGWRPLFALPIVFRQIHDEHVVSRTIPAIPQHVYLGLEAFRAEEVLRESIVHEVSHVWLAIVTEVWPLHDAQVAGDFSLPSGTANKTATQVLFACLFAASVHRYYETLGLTSRSAPFARYLAESLNILESYGGLTAAGEDLRKGLAAHSRSAHDRAVPVSGGGTIATW
jgi:hypothetical protein